MAWFGGKCPNSISGSVVDRCPINEFTFRKFVGVRFGRYTYIKKYECSRCNELFEKTLTPLEAETRDSNGLQIPIRAKKITTKQAV